MQKRIRQIAAGKFESDQPSLSISDEELVSTRLQKDRNIPGIEITSENHIQCRHCLLHPPRMECLTPSLKAKIYGFGISFIVRVS